MVFLSAAPYYAMMRKLAAARKRRERRMQRFLEKRAGITLRAGSIATPSVGLPGASFLPSRRVSVLSIADMSLPAAAPVPAPAEPAGPLAAADGRGERPSTWRPATRVANPWLDTPYTPARVAGGVGEVRPAERVVARLENAQRATQAERVVGALPPSAQRRVARAKQRVEIEEAAPVQLSEAEVVR
ncbi:MAG: hypothetical protein FJ102_07745, partial [Deltaproteobacteria bacterium]|nr:hypothetical protein [Deltaproteobacteria bacterium]